MCDVIKIRLKSRGATRSGKGTQPLNNKTAVEWPILILKLGLTNFRWNFYLILLLVASLPFRRMTSNMPLSSASSFRKGSFGRKVGNGLSLNYSWTKSR